MNQNLKSCLIKIKRYLPFTYFIVAVFFFGFIYGYAVRHWQVTPYKYINKALKSGKELRATLFNDQPDYENFAHLCPIVYEKEGVAAYNRDRVSPGVTLLTGPWKKQDDWNLGIRLVDFDGRVLHEWITDPVAILGESPHKDFARGSKFHKTKTYIHGSLLLANGDVIFNLEYLCLARLNAESEVVWVLPYRTHHSIFQDEEGSIWVCGQKWRGEKAPEYPGLRPFFTEDMIVKVSLDGVVEREISVLKAIYESGHYSLLYLNPSESSRTEDVLHLNDVEVLGKSKADAFDIFSPGDIMISVRFLNSIFVLDGETERIKWSVTDSLIAQHDPDFTDDGYITVFDNHIGYNGSRILRIEPSTKKIEILYGNKRNQYFYTKAGGKHQHLPNGNMLITEARSGRVFEVTSTGEIVWDWVVSRWNENSIPEILEGTRYGMEYTDFIDNENRD